MGTNGAHTPAEMADEHASEALQETAHTASGSENVEAELPRSSASTDRAEISRLNGSKSRGPKTVHGKNQSRRNAVKHGLRAQTLLLQIGTEEENAAFESLRVCLEREFPARTIEEQVLVETIVLALWQKKRGLQFEARELRQELVFHGPVMDRLLRYGTAADKRLFRALAQLKQLQQENASNVEEDPSLASDDNAELQ